MRNIELRPDIRTAGGEVNDILLEGSYAGTLTLVYREGDRVTGSVQLEKESLTHTDKKHVVAFVQNYIQAIIHAVQARSCDVIMTYSSYEQVIMTAAEDRDTADLYDEAAWDSDDEAEWVYAGEEDDQDEIGMDHDSDEFELALIEERRNRAHYRVYTADGQAIAEAFLRFEGADISGEVQWAVEPDELEVEDVTELIVSDFDEDTVDTFTIQHTHEDTIVETVELTHEDLLDAPAHYSGTPDERYSAVLARDDGDILTYEIYEQESGGLPIGTATVDIQEQRLTGFIDFREPNKAEEAGAIAEVLMRELDKEKDDYDGLNLSLMYRNQFLDEFIIENETYH